MENYEMGLARQEVDNLFWKDLCDNYLEIVKERLYNENNKYGQKARKSAQKALYCVLEEILKMYSPFVPHITEYIYQELYRKHEKNNILSTSIFSELPIDNDCLEFGEAMKNVVSEVRKYKTVNGQSMKQPLESIKICSTLPNLYLLRESIMDIQACTHAQTIDVDVSNETRVEIKPLEKMETVEQEGTLVLKKLENKRKL